MAKKIFKILATGLALSAITFLGIELAMARGGGGHFSGGGGGAHFSGGGARFSGAQFRGVSGGAARISGAHFRSFNGARVSGAHGLAQLNRTHVRGLNSGSSRFARMNGAHIRGLSAAHGSHVAWNHWGNHAWRAGWNGGWGGWNGGWGFWGGSVFWPFFYGDLFAFAFWPWGYYDPFWAYGDVFIWDAMFWPGPTYMYGPGSFDVYAYGGPVRTVQQVLHDRKDPDTGFLRIRTVWPFPEKALAQFRNARRFLVPEMNLGQIAREIERHVKVPVKSIPKLGGELHTPAELVRALEEKQ